MSFTNKVDELAEFFTNNYNKVRELPTSLAGSITSAATSIPTASSGLFTKSTAVQDDAYPDMIATINSMVKTITEGSAYDDFKPQKVKGTH